MAERVLSKVLWMKNAACKEESLDIFISHDKKDIDKAKRICSGCKAKTKCAVEYWDIDCVAGGLTYFERLKIQWKRIEKEDDNNWSRVS